MLADFTVKKKDPSIPMMMEITGSRLRPIDDSQQEKIGVLRSLYERIHDIFGKQQAPSQHGWEDEFL